MKFRDDIDVQNTWIVSDTHFGHENIVGYCARPIDHDQVMLEQWRAYVPDDATVLHLGDLCWKGNAWFRNIIAPRLTGARKLLILGNHDKGRPSFYRDCGFKIVRPFAIRYGTQARGLQLSPRIAIMPGMQAWSVSFSHYPWDDAEEKRPMMESDVRIHGHIHNNGYYDGRQTGVNSLIPFLRNHINVSVEQTRYRPVNLGLLLDAALLGKVPNAS